MVPVTFEPPIVARGLHKTYRVYHAQGRGWVKAKLAPFGKERFYVDHPALVDVSLTVERGEILGIIGRNGSGKSTLLRLLAGISVPTSGSVRVSGQVRCLLATGISFNPRFTGRENIFYGSATMGIPPHVSRERLEEIIEFSELGEAIDRPSGTYSTGMATKLAFAVAFQDIPEILLLDEAMSAGDMFFQHKCDQKVREIVSSGATVVMATHSIGQVETVCTRAIMLEDGRVVAEGKPLEVTDRYREMLAERERNRPRELAERSPMRPPPTADEVTGGREVTLISAQMAGADGEPADTFGHGEAIELRLRLRVAAEVPMLRFALDLLAEDFGVRVAMTGTEHLSAETGELSVFPLRVEEGEHEIIVRFPRNELGSGLYSWSLAVRPFDGSAATRDYLKLSRLAPFRSVSFPGHPIGELRRVVTEPAVELEHRIVESAIAGAAVEDRAG